MQEIKTIQRLYGEKMPIGTGGNLSEWSQVRSGSYGKGKGVHDGKG